MSTRSALAGGAVTVAIVAALGNPAAQDAAAEEGASVLLRTVVGVPGWDVPDGAGGDVVGGVVLRLAVLIVLAAALCAAAGRARARGPALLAGWGALVVAGAVAAAVAYAYAVTVILPGGTFGDLDGDGLVAAANDGAAFGLWAGWLVGLAVAVATRPERAEVFDEPAAVSAHAGRITDPPAPWWAPTSTVDENGRTTTRPGPTVFPPGGMPPVVAGVDDPPNPRPATAPATASAPGPHPEPEPDPDATAVIPDASDTTLIPDATPDPTTPFPR
jgi:hypothetical protein